jgi:PPP family 3-phenylpropionic acid transporter
VPVTIRIGLYYATLFVVSGVAGPYISLWFHDRGLTGAQIGLILAAPSIARTVTAPALALWADGFALRRTPMLIMAGAAGLAFAAFAVSRGFWSWCVLWFVAQTLFGTLSPLADIITLRRAARDGFNYGFPRGIGSGAYVAANVVMGLVLTLTGTWAVIAVTVGGAMLAALGARLLLPADPVHEDGERRARAERMAGLSGLLKDPLFMTAVVSVGLIQASHGFYYGFSNLSWARQGLPHALFGLLWGTGVAVEVGFLWFFEPWRRRVGAERLVIWGAVAGVVRWTCLAFSPPLWLLFPIQALHTLTFAACYVGSLQLIERLSPPSAASAAQALSAALSGGLLIGLATSLSGVLFDRVGAYGYLAMSLLCLAGLLGALALGPLQAARTLKEAADARA